MKEGIDMDKLQQIINIMKKNKLDDLNKYNKNKLLTDFLDILEIKIEEFDYSNDEDINYLNNIFKYLPICIENKISNKKEVYDRLQKIRYKIKPFLVQKPGNIEKTNKQFKSLKNIIENIETISISLLYDYIGKYEGSKYELIDYIIFDVKNISLLEDALKRFPHLVNLVDKDNVSLINNIFNHYLKEIKNYSKDIGIDNIIYYDEIIDLFLNDEKLIFDIIDKQNILKKINSLLKNINEPSKQRKVFYLNSLVNKINNINYDETISYLQYKYDINTYFNEAINSEVDQVVNNYITSKNRKIINDYILTFDGVDAKEIDDALSIEILENNNYKLGVHIADPMSIINENSIIFDEAYKRTTSIYLSDLTYPMFPNEISCDLVSLKEKVPRNAISYYFEIDKNGDVKNFEFAKTVIKVRKNMTYSDFNKILEQGTKDMNLLETIKNLSNISDLLKIYYNSDALYGSINRSENNITNTNITGMTKAEKVVESTMVFTNYMVAKYFRDNKLPFIFRNHIIDSNIIEQLNQFEKSMLIEEDNNKYLKYIEVVKNIYPKAQYNIQNKGHYGLGIDCYCHITSPLRRFSDIIGSICLEKLYFNEYTDNDIKQLKELIITSSYIINNKRTSIEKFSLNYEYVKTLKK